MNNESRQSEETGREPLVDSYGRVHTSLRISVTDRCNVRCFYCMPAEGVQFLPRKQLLTYEEIARFVRVTAQLGVNRLRLTGGEPLVRAELPSLVSQLVSTPGIEEVALTTNGLQLGEQASDLRKAGLHRINVSLDTLDANKFERMTRRPGLEKVLAGIAEAQRVGFDQIRLNAIAIRGETEPEIVPLVEFALQQQMHLRFIEYMPLDGDGGWQAEQVLSGERIREVIEEDFGPLEPAERPDASQPAIDYRFVNHSGLIGFIHPVSQPFCTQCNRLRLTAEGQVRNCLFSASEADIRALIRGGATDDQIAGAVRASVAGKLPGHGIDDPDFLRPERAMYQIGG
ncbi:MAG: GTP 3',8-cyclase MoaA [Aeoliella sp.]